MVQGASGWFRAVLGGLEWFRVIQDGTGGLRWIQVGSGWLPGTSLSDASTSIDAMVVTVTAATHLSVTSSNLRVSI